MSKTRRQDKDGIYRRPDSPYYWASYVDASGKRTRRSTGTKNQAEAKAILSKWKLEAFREITWDEKPVPSFDELLLMYLKSRDISSSEKSAANHLQEFFGGRSAFLEVRDIAAFVEYQQQPRELPQYEEPRPRAAGTINKMLVMLSAALNYWNRKTGGTLPNPVSGQKLKEPEGRTRWLSEEEAGRLIVAAAKNTDHLAPAIALSLCTGLRSGELLSLEWSYVDLDANLIQLPPHITKSKKSRVVPLNATAVALIRGRLEYVAKHCPDSKWVICSKKGERFKSLKTAFKTALRLAGIENFRWHDQRHTFASWLITDGVKLPEVRDLLGHSSVKLTERYAHLAPENLIAAVERLPDLSHDRVTLNSAKEDESHVTH